MNALLFAAVIGFQSLTLVDQDCKMLEGSKTVAAANVALGKDLKPFQCAGKPDGQVTCRSSRSGKDSEFRVEKEDDGFLVLRYIGTGEWTAVISVDKKAGRFQVASSRPLEGKGLTAELCVGTAAVK